MKNTLLPLLIFLSFSPMSFGEQRIPEEYRFSSLERRFESGKTDSFKLMGKWNLVAITSKDEEGPRNFFTPEGLRNQTGERFRYVFSGTRSKIFVDLFGGDNQIGKSDFHFPVQIKDAFEFKSSAQFETESGTFEVQNTFQCKLVSKTELVCKVTGKVTNTFSSLNYYLFFKDTE